MLQSDGRRDKPRTPEENARLREGRDLYRSMFGHPPLAATLSERHRDEILERMGEGYRVGIHLRRGCQTTWRAFNAGLRAREVRA